MKSVTFEEARAKLEGLFQLAVAGETVIIAHHNQKVALRALSMDDPAIAPPGYFNDDYEPADIDQLNNLASRGPAVPLT